MDWRDVVKSVAPWIGTALGGPLGGMALDAAASALGVSEKTTDAIKTAISGATPEQMLALKKADQDFQVTMKQLGFKQITDLESIAAADRDSARKMQMTVRSKVPAWLTWFLVMSFLGTLIALFLVPVPTPNRDIVVYMAGQLSGFTAAAVAFWLGTTRNSQDKTELIAKAPPVA